ncbi:MAG: transposase [Bacilli bacterium]
MMGIKSKLDKDQIQMFSMNDLVPKNHLVRKLDKAIDLDFIYDLVRPLYSNEGRESIDPVVLFKLNIIQFTFGIRSMRQTIKEIETNNAYRWYIGYSLTEELPHFSTYSKNYVRRYADSDVFEEIFARIIHEIDKRGFIDETNIFIDGTHIKANANTHKYENAVIEKSTKFYEEELIKEINIDRAKHNKKPLKKREKTRN